MSWSPDWSTTHSPFSLRSTVLNSMTPNSSWSRCWPWLLALVAGQDIEPSDQEGTWKIERKVTQHRVIATVDPETRHKHKPRSSYRDGYKAHIAVEPETGLITACDLTPANAGNGPTGIKLLESEPAGLDVLADSAYGSGDSLAKLADAKQRILINPWPLSQNANPGDDQFNRADEIDRCTHPWSKGKEFFDPGMSDPNRKRRPRPVGGHDVDCSNGSRSIRQSSASLSDIHSPYLISVNTGLPKKQSLARANPRRPYSLATQRRATAWRRGTDSSRCVGAVALSGGMPEPTDDASATPR